MPYYNQQGQKDLPPVPRKDNNSGGLNFQGNRNVIRDDADDFNFVDPNSHIDNSFKDNTFRPTNPNISLTNRIIYDYDTDGDSDSGIQNKQYSNANPSQPNMQRELARTNNNNLTHQNDFYSQSNKSNISRQTSTKSNPFKEDPFNDGSNRNSAISRNRPFEDNPDGSFDNVPIKYNTTGPTNDENNNNASTSLLNDYRNNKFYNNGNAAVNGGFRVDDEFTQNELQPRFIGDPGAEKKPPAGLLVWRGKKIAIVCYLFTVIQVIVFIAELAKMGKLTGSPIQTEPYFNPMIGPSSYVQINMGSRFVPCMIQLPGITNLTSSVFPCPNSTDVATGCTLSYLCGLGTIKEDDDAYEPNQWYRIITPIFLHGGFIHIISNMLLQLMLGVDMERQIGSCLFLFIYMASGISGNIFGANFAQNGLSSTGASGALFGIIGVNLFHFIFFTNKSQMHPKIYRKNLTYLAGEIVFTLILGLLPGLDNFSHIGGFVVGCLLSVVCLKDPNFIFQDRYRYQRDPNDIKKSAIPARNSLNSFTPFDYDGAAAEGNRDHNQIRVINSRVAKFFPNINIRKQNLFFAWSLGRVICGILAFLWFYFLSVNLWRNGGGHCSWCKYLSCIPVKDWCSMGKIQLEDLGTADNNSIVLLSTFLLLIGSHFKYLGGSIHKTLNSYKAKQD